ncbi:MAG: hypothetical protein INH10_19680, partial [Rhodocyclaceae bacterium]|nr:hypothetical protein [Rhodocyclaceae bacterium]
ADPARLWQDEVANDIVGGWRLIDQPGKNAVITFTASGQYFLAEDQLFPGTPGGQNGMERGTYAWNSSTGSFQSSTLVDTNGEWGLSDTADPIVSAVISADTLTLSDGSKFSRLISSTNPLVGSWQVDQAVISFAADGAYFIAEDSAGTPGGQNGMERGTYTWNPLTGAFSSTTLVDTNGEWGLSHPPFVTNVQVNGDVLSLIDTAGVDVLERAVAGNLARLESDDFTPVVGGIGDNTINLSALSTGLLSGFDIRGNAGNDTIVGSAQADEIRGGSGADTVSGGGGADTFVVAQGHAVGVTVSLAAGASASVLDDGDSFVFAGGAGDRILDLSGGEQVRLVSRFGDLTGVSSPGLMSAVPTSGLAIDQGYFLVRGNYSVATGEFIVAGASGADTLVVFDGDQTTSTPQQTAFVITGVAPSQLATSVGSNTFSRISGPSLTITDDEPGTANIAGGSVVYTFTFGAAVTGFDASDVTVSGGTKGTVTAVSPTQYTLPVTPTSNSSGTIAVSVAEGAATAVTGGLGNLAATAPSQAFDTSRPQNNQGSFTEVANSTISAGFGETVTFSSSAGFTLSRLNGATIGFTGLTGNSTSTLVFATTETLGATDVVKVRYEASVGNLADAAGNTVNSFELYIGGNGASVIDLGAYGSSFSQFLRGNGGADELVGTSGNDVLADGGGADSLRGGRGSDTLRLSEASGYSRDVVIVKRGDSTRTQTDAVLPSGINPTGSGFDTFSATASAHDVLDLQSRVIAADASNVDGIDSGVIARHDITSGIVTFRDASGTVVTIGQATNLGLALTYLEQNITTAGTTVAFQGDFDNNGVADSLWVFQDLGVLSGVTIADTVLRVGYANPTDLAAVTLGTAAGANVLQLQDTTTPEPENFALVTGSAGGLQLQFTETVSLGTQFNTGLTLLKNGTTVMAGTGTANTNVITITTGTALVDTDWVMVRPNYDPLDPARLWQDEAGNLARLAPDDSTLAVGGSGDNTMNLSALTTGLSSGFDIRGNAGNDTIVGSAQADEIRGGSGADTVSGGGGVDTFVVAQGHAV